MSWAYVLTMTSPEWSNVVELYQRIVCGGVMQYLEKQAHVRVKGGIYSAQVVMWLMMLEACHGSAALASALPLLRPAAVSEQALAEKAPDSAPPQALIIGDRNFGVFSIAWAAQQRHLSAVVRLTQPRASKIAGPLGQPGCQEVVWKPSRSECRKHSF